MVERTQTLNDALEALGQQHLVKHLDTLDDAGRQTLVPQLESLNVDELQPLIDTYVRRRPQADVPDPLVPAPYYAVHRDDDATMREAGEDLIRAGRVAAFTVAGGQGTRLGWNGPKGTFPATPITGKPLFRCLAEQILASQQRYGVIIPWYIMTSPMNDADSRAFFLDNNCFGLDRRNIFMFPQGVMPCFEAETARLLLDSPTHLATNPDGHGGSIKALRASGAIEDMRGRGIEHISYVQVDNPLAKVIDPVFIGRHAAAADSSGQMSSKMVPKIAPEEKVGVFCQHDGRTMVIEYSDLPEDLMHQRDADGQLRFLAGSIAIHMMSVAFVEHLTADADRFALPYHRADKKVPYFDPQTGRQVQPDQPNGVKLETFVFDALPLAESSIVCETSRVEEFAPIKNADGADSPATSHQLQIQRAASMLEDAGVTVPRNADGHVQARIEISPLTALDVDDLRTMNDLPASIDSGASLTL
jgi:UDP-N-acetylglucosamine/UDP-N-acetylgalactosamine diphosphorylase